MDSEILEKAKLLGYSNIVKLLQRELIESEYSDLALICENNIYKNELMDFLMFNNKWTGIYFLLETLYDEEIIKDLIIRFNKRQVLDYELIEKIINYACENNFCVILKYLLKRKINLKCYLPKAVDILCKKGNIQTLNMIIDGVGIGKTDILNNSKAIEIAFNTKNNSLIIYLYSKFAIKIKDPKT